MRLLTYRASSGERLAVAADAETAIDVEDLLADGPWTMPRVLTDPGTAIERIAAALAPLAGSVGQPIGALDVLAPVPRPGKIVAVGRNYREHASEEAAMVPEEPLLFAKFPSSVVGNEAVISWSASITGQVDYEAELAVVMGRRARHVATDQALGHVLGYMCLNDVSARDLQVRDGQWVRAKSLDTFCPMGPWLVTADELGDPANLSIECRVNGDVRQRSTTRSLVHGVAELVAFCSSSFTLDPGDVIATGTPGGVGAFRDPPLFLGDGDVVEVEIGGIGVLRNTCSVSA